MTSFWDYKVKSFTDKFSTSSPWILPILIALLIVSNIFMAMAWYHHLKTPDRTFIQIIAISIIFVIFEYTANIHANALGKKKYSLYQLKIMQEVITLSVFIGYAFFEYGEKMTWRYGISFALILSGAVVAFTK